MSSEKTVAIHQPNYLRWFGFFDKVNKADVLILMDNVQYPRRSWANRVRIKGSEGGMWLSVPVKVKGRYDQSIAQAEVSYEADWVNKHLKTLERCYEKTAYFDEIFPPVEKILEKSQVSLADLNRSLIEQMMRLLGIESELRIGNQLGVEGKATELLIGMTQAVGGTVYLSGDGADGYQVVELYAGKGIELAFQQFSHPRYEQPYGEFEPGLSIFDAISNCGCKQVRSMLQQSRENWERRSPT